MYTRDTELRRLQSNDVNRLAEALGLEGGRKLMETIPKSWSTQDTFNVGDSAARGSNKWIGEYKGPSIVELKYKPEQIRLIEEATKQTSGCYFAEILIQEWSTSGRKHERPTVGLLLQLLIKADLWNAADFVAEHFLNEPLPERPLNGPGAKVDISIPSECFRSVGDFVNDSIGFPDTETLIDNANCVNNSVTDHNRDYYTKFAIFNKDLNGAAPKPPPRTQRKNQQPQVQQSQTNNDAATVEAGCGNKISPNREMVQLPKLQNKCISSASGTMSAHNIPELSDLLDDNSRQLTTVNSDEVNGLPMLTLIDADIATGSGIVRSIPVVASTSNTSSHSTLGNASGESLPLITELNISTNSGEISNVATGSCNNLNQLPRQITLPNTLNDDSRCNSLSNDSFDDDEENDYNGVIMADADNVDVELVDGYSGDQSLPCLSVFGRQSQSNDSSLTTVTCTSGDNSFELSLNDSSSTSTTDPTAQKK